MVITTPSGHQVTISEYLTFGQRRELEKELLGSSKINPTTKELGDIDPSILYAMQDRAFRMLVTKIVVDGKDLSPETFFDSVMSWKEEDGDMVFKKISELSAPRQQGEKK